MNEPSSSAGDLELTSVLLDRVRIGERDARDRLVRRYLPHVRAFVRGRLPLGARSLEETDDIAHIAILRALDRVDQFTPQRRGSFLAYLSVIADNMIRDRWRAEMSRPKLEPLDTEMPSSARSPLEEALCREEFDQCHAALQKLRPQVREVLILRFVHGCAYEMIAQELGLASANAARMKVERALKRLAQILGGVGAGP